MSDLKLPHQNAGSINLNSDGEEDSKSQNLDDNLADQTEYANSVRHIEMTHALKLDAGGAVESKPLDPPTLRPRKSFEETVTAILKGHQGGDPATEHKKTHGIFKTQTVNVTQFETFEKDAHNKDLSFSRMVQKHNRLHYRVKPEGNKDYSGGFFKKKSVCGTPIGFFRCRPTAEQSTGLSLGIKLYFKQLKSLIWLYLIFTLISMPSFALFYMSGPLEPSASLDTKVFFSLFTLGNLGQAVNECSQNSSLDEPIEVYCSFGAISSIEYFGAADYTQQKCDYASLAQRTPDYCDITASKALIDEFNDQCYGKKFCEFTFDRFLLPTECRSPEKQAAIIVHCQESEIQIGEYTFSKILTTQLIVSLDALIVLIFVAYLIAIKVLVKKEVELFDEQHIEMMDFGVQMTGLPPKSIYKTETNLRAMIYAHFEKVIESQKKRGQVFDKNIHDIASISFGYKSFGDYKLMQKIRSKTQQGIKQQKKLESSWVGKQKIEKKLKKLEAEIEQLRDCYIENKKKGTNKTDRIIFALIVFRQIEAQKRVLAAYDLTFSQRIWMYFSCRCKQLAVRKFCLQTPKVVRAPDPSNIYWENMGYTELQRRLRFLVIAVIGFVLVVLCSLVTLYGTRADEAIQSFSPQSECSTEFVYTMENALADYLRGKTPETQGQEPKGLLHCFCKQEFNSNVQSVYQLEFPDGQNHCQTWFGLYSAAQALIYGVPMMIGFTNFVSKFIMQKLSYQQKTHSIGQRQILAATNMMWISFINIGVMILLVNLKINYDLPLPILQGTYSEFSVEWYRLVGSSLCVQMTLMIISTHLSNLLAEVGGCFKRCWDRRCTCDARHTRKITQIEYENVNMGTQVEFDSRYSNILVVTFVTMLYGSGMPILYFVAAAYFFVTYWTDKYLILTWYAKPRVTDDTLISESQRYSGFAIFLHLLGGILMYSNAKILPTVEQSFHDSISEYGSYYSFGNLVSPVMISYIVFFALMIAIYLLHVILYYGIRSLAPQILCCCRSKQVVDLGEFERDNNDFYRCVKYSELRRLYSYYQEEVKRVHDVSNKNFVKDMPVSYKSKVAKQIKDIEAIFKDIAATMNINTSQSFEEIVKSLDQLDKKGNLEKCKLHGDLQSYDILRNEQFKQLDEIRKILDQRVQFSQSN